MISPATERMILRWVHILFGLPLLGLIYGPTDEVLPYLPVFRFVFVPALILSGLWLWKGHLVRKAMARRAMA